MSKDKKSKVVEETEIKVVEVTESKIEIKEEDKACEKVKSIDIKDESKDEENEELIEEKANKNIEESLVEPDADFIAEYEKIKEQEKKKEQKTSSKNPTSELPLLLSLRLLLPFPINSGKRCKRRIKRIGRRIANQRIRWGWWTRYRLAKMEFIYYSYRIRHPKYEMGLVKAVDDKDSNVKNFATATGVLNEFRDVLKAIVLSDNVREYNRLQAINILIGQDSYYTLYEIAKHEKAKADMLVDINGESSKVAAYIIKNFPEHCDDLLLNTAVHWAAQNQSGLVRDAMMKMESSKSLLSLCIFLRDDPQNYHLVKEIIGLLRDIIIKNLYLLAYSDYYHKQKKHRLFKRKNNIRNKITFDEIKKRVEKIEKKAGKKDKVIIDCLNSLKKENPLAKEEWMAPHEKSMLYSAHKALETIVLIFGEDKITTSNQRIDLNREMELVQNAVNAMVLESYVSELSKTVANTSKKSYCNKRVDELKNDDYNIQRAEDELRSEVTLLLTADGNEADQIAALYSINKTHYKDKNKKKPDGLNTAKYRYLTATLDKRLECMRDNVDCYPKMSKSVGTRYCVMRHGEHQFQTKPDDSLVQVCQMCGYEQNTDYSEKGGMPPMAYYGKK